MNVYDSDKLSTALTSLGMAPTPKAEQADWVILNTCNIRDKAAQKVYSAIGRLQSVTERGSVKVIVAGCVAQAEGEEIFRRAPQVAAVIGPQAIHHLPDVIAAVQAGEKEVMRLAFQPEQKFPEQQTFAQPSTATVSAFLTIQEGCDKFCSFCVVPYTRGPQYARGVASIVDEARRLSAQGAREIVLLGQNVSAWQGEDSTGKRVGFGVLLTELAHQVPAVRRWRYTTSHPNDIDDPLIAAHKEIETLMPWLHLPVQSGSDRVLRQMNRRYTVADYLQVIERLRDACPQLALSSDFIVGHPGETESDFEQTLALIDRVGFANSYCFIFSPRHGTPAAEQSLVEPAEAKSRLTRVLERTEQQQQAFNHQTVGQTLPVLVERVASVKERGVWVGKTPWMQSCQVLPSPESTTVQVGDEVMVTVAARSAYGVVGYVAA